MRRSPAQRHPAPGYPRRITAALLAAAGAVAVAPMGPACRTVGDMRPLHPPPNPFENQPDPCIELEPEVVDFGEVEVGTLPTVEAASIANICRGDLEIYDLGLADETAPFDIAPPDEVLVPGESTTWFYVRFLAGQEGVWDTRLWVETNDPELPVAEVQLLGSVVPALEEPEE